MTSDEVLMLDHVPARVAVIGGGAIGCEFASTFADLGSQVTILEGLPKILPGLDADVANVVVRSFKKKKIDIKTGVKVLGHTPHRRQRRHHGALRRGKATHRTSRSTPWSSASVAGRSPISSDSRAPRCKVTDRGFIEVDEYCRTGEPGVYAVGDIINTPQLAHVGYAEAILVIKHILGEEPDAGRTTTGCRGRSTATPRSRSSAPARRPPREAGHDVVVAKHQFRANSRAQILGELDGLVKIIAKKNADGTAGQILGVHMVGPWVTEQLSGGYLAVNWEATVAEVAEFIQPHPSLTELFGETMLSLTGRSLNA